MPINSFENYPMSWKPDKNQLKFPMYISIAELLEKDIQSGKIAPNTKLPPQRELADFLDINLSTITRAFQLCEMKGLIYGTVGKGTFVSAHATISEKKQQNTLIPLGAIQPYYQFNHIVADTAKEILSHANAPMLFEFDNTIVTQYHKKTAQKWLSQYGIDADESNIMITSGIQNALIITLLSLFHAGDKIAVDNFTYFNLIQLAKQLSIQLVGIETDKNGMLPEALEKQCSTVNIKGVYLMPCCSNPTTITMPLERRKKISDIIKKQKIMLIEDDTYHFTIQNKITPMFSLIPENTIYLHSLSKSLVAGVRAAYLVFSERFKKIFLNTANNVNLKIPLLNSEIITQLIENGTAYHIIHEKCMLSEKRNQIYQKYFPKLNNMYSLFQWLPLPNNYNGYRFEMQAEKNAVKVFCSDRFAVGNTNNISAIRIAICSPSTTAQLEHGLKIIKSLIENECENEEWIV